ncbi:MAG: hypothetical protein M1825_002464 [Sarcosagium campestre]|nr:MAG: hypothetical protein M1825_002464 [Sarcosagium campestre]
MEPVSDGTLERSPSHNSTTSVRSRHSDTVRIKPRKHASQSSSIQAATPSDKSLTSFPSLSPETPPGSSLSLPNEALRPPPSPTPQKTPKASVPPILASLTVSTPSVQKRSPLFDDSPINAHQLPGALHHTTDEHILRLVARNGAVALVRQLAEDIAGRDAQISLLKRRTEKRERALRKMLLECEVSNLDIEARLRKDEASHAADDLAGGLKNKRTSPVRTGTGAATENVEGSIDEMMNAAMADTVGVFAGPPSSDTDDRNATIRALESVMASDDEAKSLYSDTAQRAKSNTAKGWKDYIWTSRGTSRKTSRSSSIIGEANDELGTAGMERVPSGGAGRRKALQNDLFTPPDASSLTGNGNVTTISDTLAIGRDADSSSRKASTSVASWALKLVAGNPLGSKDEQRPTRDRRSTNTSVATAAAQGSRRSSTASSKTVHSAKAALMKVNASAASQRPPRSTPLIGVGPTGTIKASGAAKHSNGPASPQASSLSAGANNSGPVEMDTILPPDAQPPTVTQVYNAYHPSEHLTDRFGFIYDQKRKKKALHVAEGKSDVLDLDKLEMLTPGRDNFGVATEDDGLASPKETASPSSGSRPDTPHSEDGAAKGTTGRRWQDYLTTATFPTELLLHTPSAGVLPTVTTFEATASRKPSHSALLDPGSVVKSSAKSSTTRIVSGNAAFAKLDSPTSATPVAVKDESEPVRLLLNQLTELHDSLQRERTTKWNDFLRKVRAERRKETESAAAAAAAATATTRENRSQTALMPEVSLADGEVVGVAGLGNKGKVGRAKWNEFKSLVLGGIPVAYRAKIWAECSGASALRVPGYYDDLVRHGIDDATVNAQISMDIHRTLTDNIYFRKGPGVAKLNEVLSAYARRNAEVGYCQGMNLIAASLLLIMPTAEDTFWMLTSMIENILPPTYYDHSLLASRADQQVLRQYVRENLPKLSDHLDQLGIELEALSFQWFLSVFTDCLSAEALFRVWDVVLCTNDGSTFLFQVALALLKLNERRLLACTNPSSVYSYINHHMTNHAISIDSLIQASEALSRVVKRDDVEQRRSKVLEQEKERSRLRLQRVEENNKNPRDNAVIDLSDPAAAAAATTPTPSLKLSALENDHNDHQQHHDNENANQATTTTTTDTADESEGGNDSLQDDDSSPLELQIHSPVPINDDESESQPEQES